MSTFLTYHPGGFITAAPQHNIREQWTNATQPGDPTPAGYTSFDMAGNVVAQRALAADEAAQLAATDVAVTASANAFTLQQRAQAALSANGTYLAFASPSNTQVVNQVRALTKECTALIRLLLGQLDDTSGT